MNDGQNHVRKNVSMSVNMEISHSQSCLMRVRWMVDQSNQKSPLTLRMNQILALLLITSQVVSQSQHLPGYASSYQRDRDPNDLDHYNAESGWEDYSDEVYKELADEYQHQDNLRMSSAGDIEPSIATKNNRNQNQSSSAVQHDDRIDTGKKASMGKRAKKKKKAESYEEMASRLKCDNPWWWNAPKCTWLDVQNKNVTKRTKHNAKVSAWLIGSVSTLVILWLCSIYCFYLMRVRNRTRLQKLRNKYRPGRLELKNGRVVEYEPNQEEEEAYEELIKAIIVQEMASMI